MGNTYGAEESRLNLRKQNKRKLVYIRRFFSCVHSGASVFKQKIKGRTKRILQPDGCSDDRMTRRDVRDNLTFTRPDTDTGSVNHWIMNGHG